MDFTHFTEAKEVSSILETFVAEYTKFSEDQVKSDHGPQDSSSNSSIVSSLTLFQTNQHIWSQSLVEKINSKRKKEKDKLSERV